jgi:hypothetical protein
MKENKGKKKYRYTYYTATGKEEIDVDEKWYEILRQEGRDIYNNNRREEYDRAAQFSPFAALTGHADSIKETARLTDEYSEPSEEMKAIMNEKILFLMEQLENQPEITITFFKPDEKKQGGAYISRQQPRRLQDYAFGRSQLPRSERIFYRG